MANENKNNNKSNTLNQDTLDIFIDLKNKEIQKDASVSKQQKIFADKLTNFYHKIKDMDNQNIEINDDNIIPILQELKNIFVPIFSSTSSNQTNNSTNSSSPQKLKLIENHGIINNLSYLSKDYETIWNDSFAFLDIYNTIKNKKTQEVSHKLRHKLIIHLSHIANSIKKSLENTDIVAKYIEQLFDMGYFYNINHTSLYRNYDKLTISNKNLDMAFQTLFTQLKTIQPLIETFKNEDKVHLAAATYHAFKPTESWANGYLEYFLNLLQLYLDVNENNEIIIKLFDKIHEDILKTQYDSHIWLQTYNLMSIEPINVNINKVPSITIDTIEAPVYSLDSGTLMKALLANDTTKYTTIAQVITVYYYLNKLTHKADRINTLKQTYANAFKFKTK